MSEPRGATSALDPERWLREWGVEGLIGGLVLLAGFWQFLRGSTDSSTVLLVVCLAAAVAVSRRLPAGALALVWLAFAVQLYGGVPLMTYEVAVAVVAFGCARWGSVATIVASAVSGPLAAGITVASVRGGIGDGILYNSAAFRILHDLRSGGGLALPLLLALATLVPWLAGLALRFADRARTSEASQERAEVEASQAILDRDQAEEIARLRQQQAQLARDVHDVVGHSLAVILAQAESAQYLDDRPETLKQTLATIATSARDSLRDVRQVLSDAPTSTTDLDALVEGVRTGGRDVESHQVGTPQPLPPELSTVAYRVLQEMLTNAIRHGSRTAPITVERHWEGELRIEVQNAVDPGSAGDLVTDETVPIAAAPATDPATTPGQGLVGMRRRLEAVGGRLDVRRRASSFTCTAWIPVRSGSSG